MKKLQLQMIKMSQIGWGLLVALQFLTRIPLPISCPWNEQTAKWSLRSFTLVGVLIGSMIAGLYVLLYSYFSALFPTWLIALLVLSFWVYVTGGLHLDGWMDVADAFGSNAPLEQKWSIMKDPHVGSSAIIAVLFLLGWKLALIYLIIDLWQMPSSISGWLADEGLALFICAFIFVPTVSRWGAIVVLTILPVPNKEGLAGQWKPYSSFTTLMYLSIPILFIMLFVPIFLYMFICYLLFIALFCWRIYRIFRGVNGDILGTAIEGGELWCLAVIYIWFVMA